MNNQHQTKIIAVDMDAFYAAVEVRDNPSLFGKPLIIGSMPNERGVVSTCSYEARKYGVRSAMSIKEAYRRCPHGIYMRPNIDKYKVVSEQVHKIWATYTDICEYISLDEGFLDISNSLHLFGGATAIAHEIKRRTKKDVGLTCSVGIGYSIMSAKLASEEKKPDGFFEILTPQDLKDLIIDRSVRVIFGVGEKTTQKLQSIGVTTVRHIYENPKAVLSVLANQGKQIIDLANGIDHRKVKASSNPKSIGTERTFQTDITDLEYLKDVLLLTAQKLSFDIQLKGIYAGTVTLKITYADMQSITRSKSANATNKAAEIYKTAVELLEKVDKRPIRLIGIALSTFSETPNLQISLFSDKKDLANDQLSNTLMELQLKYGRGIVKPASVLRAQQRVGLNTKE